MIAIAAGYGHGLALQRNGTVVGWGAYLAAAVPVGLSNVLAIAAGYSHSLALKSDGSVVAWGNNMRGQTNVPPGLTNVSAIAAAGYFNLALQDSLPPVLQAVVSDACYQSNRFALSLPTQSGRVYALEYLDALSGADWKALPLRAGTGRLLTLTDLTATNVQRFYRVRRW